MSERGYYNRVCMARRNDSLSESLNCARPTEVAVQQCTAGGARSGSQGRPAELG